MKEKLTDIDTIQALFDYVVRGLLQQNEKSIGDTSGTAALCMYRGSNNKKCAAGMLIDDAFYSQSSLESKGADSPSVVTAMQRSMPNLRWTNQTTKLIRELQVIHDATSVHDWPRDFVKLAYSFGLEYNGKPYEKVETNGG